LVGRNQPLARFIAREKARAPHRLKPVLVFRCAVNRCADNCAGRVSPVAGRSWRRRGWPTGAVVAVAAAQSAENGNWGARRVGWSAKVRVIEIGICVAAHRTGQSARKNGVRFCLAVAEIRVIAAGAAKSVACRLNRRLGQRRKAHKSGNWGSAGVVAPNKPINANWQAGFCWSWLGLRNF